MTVTFLNIVKRACSRIGLDKPASIAGNTDPTVIQLKDILNEEVEELQDYPWLVLQREATFTTTGVELQGDMETLAPNYDYVVNNTMWDRTFRRKVFGPKPGQEWQQIKAWVTAGPFSQFRIWQGNLYFWPVPTAAQDIYFEYQLRYCWTDGATEKETPTADTDYCLLDSRLLTQGLVWRFKQQKGLDYAEDKLKYERLERSIKSKDGSKDFLSLSGAKNQGFPGVFVPEGSWTLP